MEEETDVQEIETWRFSSSIECSLQMSRRPATLRQKQSYREPLAFGGWGSPTQMECGSDTQLLP